MNNYIKFLAVALVLVTFTNCKKDEVKLSDYKYSDKTLNVACSQIDSTLLKEALLSFEDDIANFYARNGKPNLSQAYSRTVNLGIYGRGQYDKMVSDHSIEIFNVLKSKTDLWHTSGNKTTLNYNHPFVKCLAENIKDKEIQTTFNALLSTNSMRQDIFGEALRRKTSLALRDKYLATYIAFDFYYAPLFNVDLEALQAQKNTVNNAGNTENKIKNNQDSHAGHNH